MAPADDRREALLDAMADHMLAEGLAASTLRPLARAAGTSDRMLLYYFPTKDALLEAVLSRVAARMTDALEQHRAPGPLPADALFDRFAGLVLSPAFGPTRALFLEIASRAARADPLCRAVGKQIGEGFLAWIAAQIDAPTEAARIADARRLLTRVEGRVFLDALGIEGD